MIPSLLLYMGLVSRHGCFVLARGAPQKAGLNRDEFGISGTAKCNTAAASIRKLKWHSRFNRVILWPRLTRTVSIFKGLPRSIFYWFLTRRVVRNIEKLIIATKKI